MDPVIDTAILCAERGWKATFTLTNGEVIKTVFITGTDWEQKFVSVERVGERHLSPRLIDLREVKQIEPHW